MIFSEVEPEINVVSDAETGDLCVACRTDGEYRQAVKFCLECNQPICQTCVDSHRRIKQIKDHKLVDNKSPEAVAIAQTLASVLTCPKHSDKEIELMCVDHDVFCCSICATVTHRNCRQIQEIAEAQRSVDPKGVLKHLTDAKQYMENIVKHHRTNIQDSQTQINQTIPNQVSEMKASLTKTFDKLESFLVTQAKQIGSQYNNRIKTEIDRWESFIHAVDDGTKLITVMQQNGSDIHKFVAAKNVQKTLFEVDTFISNLRNQVSYQKMSFTYDNNSVLQNGRVMINGQQRTLAEVTESRAGRTRKGDAYANQSLADISVKTEVQKMPQYPYFPQRQSFGQY